MSINAAETMFRVAGICRPCLRCVDTHRSEEHTSELQSPCNLVWRLLLEKVGPDLSHTGRQFTLAELPSKLKDPDAQISAGDATVTARLRDFFFISGGPPKESLLSPQSPPLD